MVKSVELTKIGRSVLNVVASFGEFCRFTAQTFAWLPAAATHVADIRLLGPQFYQVGALSVPIVAITGMFVGMVLAVQAFVQFQSVGLENHLGSVINLSVVRELGPVLTGVMLAGRVGGALTAELGTMRVTEQIDALRCIGADPIRHLVVPRFLACLLLTPLLTCYADFTGVLGGYVISAKVFTVSENLYWRYSANALELWDLFCGMTKSLLFGGAIGLVSCFRGFYCRPGAEGVGRACTDAFVTSFVSILTLDFFLAVLFKGLYEVIWGFKSVF